MRFSVVILVFGMTMALQACKSNDTASSACAVSSVQVADVNLSIEGLGFFVFDVGNETLYGRHGDFCVDLTGHLINGDGQYVLGFEPLSASVFNTGALTRMALALTNGAGGALTGVSVGADGIVTGRYTLGSNVVAGQLGLGMFTAPQNLETVDNGMCRETAASGAAWIGAPGTTAFGTIQSGLEGTYVCDQGRFDIQVVGTGFFRLNNSGTAQYDADITLGVDRDGYYVDDHGYRITGYAVDADGNINTTLTDLRAVTGAVAPAATSVIGLDANLNAAAAPPSNGVFGKDDADSYNFAINADVFDSLGDAHAATFYFVATGVADTWHLHAYLDETLMRVGGAGFQTISFAGGVLASVSPLVYDPINPSNGASNLGISVDIDGLTQLNSDFVVNAATQNGYAFGVVTATHIAADGAIALDFSNGRADVPHAQLVLARFSNHSMLLLSDDGETYLQTPTSGIPLLDVPGSAGFGTVSVTAR